MASHLLKEEIIHQLKQVSNEINLFCGSIPETLFFKQPAIKWSISQNLAHLVTSANMTRLAYSLPKFMVRLYTGKPNRSSRGFDELATKYDLKLMQGGVASGRYIPKPSRLDKATLITAYTSSMNKLIKVIDKKWDDEQLDQYLAPHPLLGKITLRELAYFTIYHTTHHLTIIRERLVN